MIRKIAIALAVVLVLQGANVGFRQANQRIVCTDKLGKKHVFNLGRDVLSLDGTCRADDGQAGSACRRQLEVLGAEGGMCERDRVAELL